jgi:hypothetical protein
MSLPHNNVHTGSFIVGCGESVRRSGKPATRGGFSLYSKAVPERDLKLLSEVDTRRKGFDSLPTS